MIFQELQSLVESNRVDGMLLTRALEDDRALQYLSQVNFPTALTGTCRYDNIIQVDTDNEGAAEKMTTLIGTLPQICVSLSRI